MGSNTSRKLRSDPFCVRVNGSTSKTTPAQPQETILPSIEYDGEEIDAHYENLERKRRRSYGCHTAGSHDTRRIRKLRRILAKSIPQGNGNDFARATPASPATSAEDPDPVSPFLGRITHTVKSESIDFGAFPVGEGSHSSKAEESDSGVPKFGDIPSRPGSEAMGTPPRTESDGSSSSEGVRWEAQPPQPLEYPERIPGMVALQQTIKSAIDQFQNSCFPEYRVEVKVNLIHRRAWTWEENGKRMLRIKLGKG